MEVPCRATYPVYTRIFYGLVRVLAGMQARVKCSSDEWGRREGACVCVVDAWQEDTRYACVSERTRQELGVREIEGKTDVVGNCSVLQPA